MDLSVFNLLMSTTPNLSGSDTPFSGSAEINTTAESVQVQENLRTGEAFLKVLEQVRAGKTEKSAESFFNTMSARADASSALKEFKTNEKANESVKVVKLHIKRTRASEKLQKAEENAPIATEPTQNRQKIPGKENIAATEPVRSDSDAPFVVFTDTDQPVTVMPEESVCHNEDKQNDLFASEELTTADILINAALQTQPANPQTPQTQSFDGQDLSATVSQQTDQPVVLNEKMPVCTDRIASEMPQETHTRPQTPQTAETKQKISFSPQDKKSFIVPDFSATKTTDPIPAAFSENNRNAFSFKDVSTKDSTPVPVAPEPVPVRKSDLPKIPLNSTRPAKQETAEPLFFADQTDYDLPAPQKEARRQADQLAAKLPADAKIVISVQTNKAAAESVFAPRPVHEKPMTEKRTSISHETESPLFPAEEEPLVQKEKPLHLVQTKPVSDNPDRSTAQQQPLKTPAESFTVIPVEQKNLLHSQPMTETTTSVQNANAPTTHNAPGFVQIGQPLKGKAVSGSATVAKHTALNELSDQIKINIKKALKAGLDKIDVVLKHKDLGTIKVHLEIDKDGNMKAVLSAARTETLDMLRADLSGLKQSLADSGFNMNDEAFSFNYRGERYDGKDKEHKQHRRFDTEPNEAEEIRLRPAATDYSGLYALNIKV